MVSNEKSANFRRKSVIWISFLILDAHLHRTSRIEILRHLIKRGYNAYLIAVRSRKRYHLRNSNIHIIAIPLRYVPIISPMLFGLAMLFFLPFYLIRKRPDFIITEPSTPVFGFLWKPLLSRFIGYKMILDIRSTTVGTSSLRRRLFEIFQFNISVHVAREILDGITIITSEMRKEVCNKFNINPESVGIWSSAVSAELFMYERNLCHGLELRRRFGLSNKFIIFYHGALGGNRGIIESVEAMAIIKKEYPNVVLFLLGDRPPGDELGNLIRKYSIQEIVVTHAAVDYEDVPKYIAMSDVCILPLPDIPDWRNQCPLKLLEYLAMERTVIVTDIPANREVIGDAKCGIYVSSCDPSEIAKAMVFAYHNKKRLKEWGKSGRRIVVHRYSWDRVAEDLENYLLKVAT